MSITKPTQRKTQTVAIEIDACRGDESMKLTTDKKINIPGFPELPGVSEIGTLSGRFSHDRQWLVFRYGVVNGQLAKYDEDYKETALWVVLVCDVDNPVYSGKPFDSWMPQICDRVVKLEPENLDELPVVFNVPRRLLTNEEKPQGVTPAASEPTD